MDNVIRERNLTLNRLFTGNHRRTDRRERPNSSEELCPSTFIGYTVEDGAHPCLGCVFGRSVGFPSFRREFKFAKEALQNVIVPSNQCLADISIYDRTSAARRAHDHSSCIRMARKRLD
jgi:hypothetical protein